MNNTILIDTDGILTDFVSSAYHFFNKDVPDDIPYAIWDDLGMLKEDFWSAISGRDFWLQMETYETADRLITEIMRHFGDTEHIVLCSSPHNHHEVFLGRSVWLQKTASFNSQLFEQHIGVALVTSKNLLATDSSILIDDFDINVEAFGGKGAILYPRPWNSMRNFKGDAIEYVIDSLYPILDGSYEVSKQMSFDLPRKEPGVHHVQ